MPSVRSLALALLLAASASASAQEPPAAEVAQAAAWSVDSGDAWLDTWLADTNTYAARYRAAFVDELVRYQSAPRPLVVELLDAGARPADVYLACATAQALGRPCREIVGRWRMDPALGWREVLDGLGAGPGSEPFVRVRRGLVSSFDRWARPIRLDAALRRAFPDREG